MNLTDVEKAVVELSSRHPDLNKEFLRTLLEASGWDGKNIKEAEVILSARLAIPTQGKSGLGFPASRILTNQTAKTDITFFHPDGTEEGDLAIQESDEVGIKEKNLETKLIEVDPKVDLSEKEKELSAEMTVENGGLGPHVQNASSEKVVTFAKEESLIVSADRPRPSLRTADIPENLPLVPFESSPHVWSFGRYKDTFHPDQDVAPEVRIEPVIQAKQQEEKQIESHLETLTVPVVNLEVKPEISHVAQQVPHEPEIDFEKTPITKGDESLVVLAGVMLLAIMLILGYMYSNGRL